MAEYNTKEYNETKCEAFKRGTSVKKLFGTIDKTNQVANNDKLIIMHNVAIDSILHSVKVTSPVMAGFTGVKIVALKPNSKEIIKKNSIEVVIGENISFADLKNGIDVLPLTSKNKSLSQILGASGDVHSNVDIAFVSAAVGVATGTIYCEIEFSSPFN